MADDELALEGIPAVRFFRKIPPLAVTLLDVCRLGVAGQSVAVDLVVELLRLVVLAGSRLLDDELVFLFQLFAEEHVVRLLQHHGAEPSPQVALRAGAVEVDDAHDAALEVGGQLHQLFHQSRGLLAAVDVERQVADVVEDDEVGAVGLDGQLIALITEILYKLRRKSLYLTHH